jgi:hypothetical protein
MTTKSNAKPDTLEFYYASGVLLKLYKAKVISRRVFEIAERKCRERLNAAA